MAGRSLYGGDFSAWAEITDEDGDSDDYPVSSIKIQYAINSVPTATITIPYGYNINSWFGGSSLSLPSSQYSHYTEIKWQYRGSTEVLFKGYITGMKHSEVATGSGSGVSLHTEVSCQGWLGLISQQFNHILRGTSPYIYSGNPWFSDVSGSESSLYTKEIREQSISIPNAVLDALIGVCDTQLNYDVGFEAGTRGAAQAKSALICDNEDLSDDSGNYLKHYSWTSRNRIARQILNSLSEPGGQYAGYSSGRVLGGNLWTALMNFCKQFNYAVLPRVNDFGLAPMAYPGYTSGKWIEYTFDDISSYHLPISGLEPNPIRGVVMVDRHSGPWGQISNVNEVVGGYDLSWLDKGSKFGRVITSPFPAWFPTYASDSSLIANLLCQQVAINEAFGGSRMYITIPTISGIGPGSLVKLDTDKTFPGLGDNVAFGVARGVEYTISVDPLKVETSVLLTHIMSEDVYGAIALQQHPVAQNYLTYSFISPDEIDIDR